VINTQLEYAAAKLLEMVKRTMSAILILAMTSALPAEAQENWICEETAFYSIYEDISRTESRKMSTSRILKWIDTNTIGLESILLERVSPNSETFFNQNSASYLYINRDEEPHIVRQNPYCARPRSVSMPKGPVRRLRHCRSPCP
jgi:hypothetical protein